MSIGEIIDQRIEFEPHPMCPACGYMDHHFLFTTTRAIRTADGQFGCDVAAIGDPPDPHLIITCARCNLQREMETFR